MTNYFVYSFFALIVNWQVVYSKDAHILQVGDFWMKGEHQRWTTKSKQPLPKTTLPFSYKKWSK